MTEEEKAVAAAAEAKATEEAKANENAIDFKAELEKAKEKLGQAEHVIMKLKKEQKEETPKPQEIDIAAIEESIKEKLLKEQEAKLEQFKLEQAKSTVDAEIAKLTSDPDEQALIKFNYENRIVKSGFDGKSISEDLKAAHLISNRPRFEKTLEELKQKAISNMTKNGGEAPSDAPKQTMGKVSPEVEAWAKKVAVKNNTSVEEVLKKLAKNS